MALPEDSVVTTISVSFSNPDAAEARAAQWALAEINADRADAGEAQYANVAAMCVGLIKRQVINWQRLECEARANENNLIEKFMNAPDATRQQIIDMLNP